MMNEEILFPGRAAARAALPNRKPDEFDAPFEI